MGIPAANIHNLLLKHHEYKKNSPCAILKTFADDLPLMPFGLRTCQSYWNCLRQLSGHFNVSPDEVSPEQLRQYFIHLKTVKKVASQTSTQSICAIKLFWEKTLRRAWPHEVQLVRTDTRFKLPVVLSTKEVHRIPDCVARLYHRTALITIYSCGLRL